MWGSWNPFFSSKAACVLHCAGTDPANLYRTSDLFSILAPTSPRKHSLKDKCMHTHLHTHTLVFNRILSYSLSAICLSSFVCVCVRERESKSEVQLNPQKRDIMHIHTHGAYGVIICCGDVNLNPIPKTLFVLLSLLASSPFLSGTLLSKF